LSPYELDSFPHTFRHVNIMRAFKEAVPYNLELLDLLFNLKRVVLALLMSTCSIK